MCVCRGGGVKNLAGVQDYTDMNENGNLIGNEN